MSSCPRDFGYDVIPEQEVQHVVKEVTRQNTKGRLNIPSVSTVVPVFICPQNPQNKRRKLTIHDGSSSRAHTNQPHGLGR